MQYSGIQFGTTCGVWKCKKGAVIWYTFPLTSGNSYGDIHYDGNNQNLCIEMSMVNEIKGLMPSADTIPLFTTNKTTLWLCVRYEKS